ncbi:MAG: Flp pilus assembly complex ATPase component TadA [Candidatus Omnitrophica bacterium]|nr:Flp pilus assembly complex ATPase component TadA [Candidatus Omnitrophota bacterium]
MPLQDSIVNILLKKGLISQEQLLRAKEDMKKTNLPIERTLEKLGFISEEKAIQAVAEELQVPYVNLAEYIIQPEAISTLSENVARRLKAIPLFRVGDTLTVVMADPKNILAIDEIRHISKIQSIEPLISTEKAIISAIDQSYGMSGNFTDIVKLVDKTMAPMAGSGTDNSQVLAKIVEEAPVIKLVNLIISRAVKENASDIHIEPDARVVRVRYRVDGILHEALDIPPAMGSVVASRIKIQANMNIAETRRPQDGKIEMKVENKSIDIRISTLPTVHGENIVLRILDKSSVTFGLNDLGFSGHDLKEFDKLIHAPYGIILVTGPTGSGKTTTLYSALSTINSIEKNIITVEDPVEYELPLIRQTQVNPKAGLTFATALRNILRQDPNVIMIGEIRDQETAEIAIQASITGHLVFSTLHTNDAASSVTRLIDMGIEPFLITSSVIGVLAQRLVRVICPKCSEKHTPNEVILKGIGAQPTDIFYKGKGCDACNGTGYKGRIGIYELLHMSEKINKLVLARASSDEIKKVAIQEGMRTLRDDGLDKMRRKITTAEEVMRVTEK